MIQKHPKGTWKPVAFISRVSSSTKKKYAQIEKEALATTRACERLAEYFIGKTFHIETNHKLLVPLLDTKNLEKYRQESSDCECVSCDAISLFLMSMVRNSVTCTLQVYVSGQARGVDQALHRGHCTSAASLG